MEFEYDAYWIRTFIFPLCITIFGLSIAGRALYGCWKYKVWRMKYIYGLFVIGMSLTAPCESLINGGIYLPIEKECDAIEFDGVVQNICEPSKRHPTFSWDKAHGVDIVIDDKQFFMVYKGDIEFGDHVQISYLPKSHFIMRIRKDE